MRSTYSLLHRQPLVLDLFQEPVKSSVSPTSFVWRTRYFLHLGPFLSLSWRSIGHPLSPIQHTLSALADGISSWAPFVLVYPVDFIISCTLWLRSPLNPSSLTYSWSCYCHQQPLCCISTFDRLPAWFPFKLSIHCFLVSPDLVCRKACSFLFGGYLRILFIRQSYEQVMSSFSITQDGSCWCSTVCLGSRKKFIPAQFSLLKHPCIKKSYEGNASRI